MAKNLNKSPVGIDTKLTIIKVENASVNSVIKNLHQIRVKLYIQKIIMNNRNIHVHCVNSKQIIHNSSRIRYKCNICLCSFTSKGYLKKHINSMHFQGKHPCTMCDYNPSEKASLICHVRVFLRKMIILLARNATNLSNIKSKSSFFISSHKIVSLRRQENTCV